jgi:hypothetical protein
MRNDHDRAMPQGRGSIPAGLMRPLPIAALPVVRYSEEAGVAHAGKASAIPTVSMIPTPPSNEGARLITMRMFQIRSQGQAALFAGILLLVIIPFFQLGALLPSGFADASVKSDAAANFAPLVAWATGHLGLVIAFPIVQAVPLLLILRLPGLLRGVIFDDGKGRVAMIAGVAALAGVAVVTILNMAFLVAAAQHYAQAGAAGQSAIGGQIRFVSITESLIANVLGGIAFALWLVGMNVALVRLGGFERAVGIVGIISAAVFAATAGLILYNPQQPQGALAGTSLASLGLWLILTGLLLVRRAPALGAEIDEAPMESGDLATPEESSEIKA